MFVICLVKYILAKFYKTARIHGVWRGALASISDGDSARDLELTLGFFSLTELRRFAMTDGNWLSGVWKAFAGSWGVAEVQISFSVLWRSADLPSVVFRAGSRQPAAPIHSLPPLSWPSTFRLFSLSGGNRSQGRDCKHLSYLSPETEVSPPDPAAIESAGLEAYRPACKGLSVRSSRGQSPGLCWFRVTVWVGGRKIALFNPFISFGVTATNSIVTHLPFG